jgi:hypothetical protein
MRLVRHSPYDLHWVLEFVQHQEFQIIRTHNDLPFGAEKGPLVLLSLLEGANLNHLS